MVDSVGSGHAPGLATSLMQAKTTQENIEVAVVKKAQDIEKQSGEAALKLIDLAGPNKVDVRV